MVRLPSEFVEGIRPRIEGRPVCVTGGAGFIGGHLVDALVSLGANVSVIDDLSNASGEHLGQLIDLEPERLRFIHASILEPAAVRQAMRGAPGGLVFHLAAIGSVPRSIEEPERTMDVNVTGTVRVLEAAREAGASRVVFSSSSSVYGEAAPGVNGNAGPTPKSEQARLDPISPYGASKAAGEHAVTAWARSYPIDTVSLRYFNVFGPRQRADSTYAAVIPAFMQAALNQKPLVIYGDGEQTRDFTHVANVVCANLLCATAEVDLGGGVFNAGTGQGVSVNDLARMISQAAETDARLEHRAPRAGDIRHSVADVTSAGARLGYRPVTSLAEGIRSTVAWARQDFAGTG